MNLYQSMLRFGGALAALMIAATLIGCARGGSIPQAPSEGRGTGQRPVVGVVLREFEFEPRPLKAKAGKVRFQLMNRGTAEHDFSIPAVQEHGAHEKHLLKPGETRIVEIELSPGSYEVICTLPGHREAGMVARLEVSP